ncbi:MAG: ester cyclase [Chloroflexi bacterium]|nr:ester cyclase [Chloroflexota bacterium]
MSSLPLHGYGNTEIARAHYEAFNERHLERGAALVAEDAQWHNVPLDITFGGKEGYREFVQGWTRAFPDFRIVIVNLFESEECVATEYIGRGTHRGPLLTPAGEVPATGRWIEVQFCDVMRIVHQRVFRVRVYFDMATLMRQLGLMA